MKIEDKITEKIRITYIFHNVFNAQMVKYAFKGPNKHQ